MKVVVGIFFFFSIFSSYCQKDYAHSILDTICSSYYDGRGYVNDGDNRAGDFIIDELKKIGVHTIKRHTFEQTYNLNVNTFPYPILVQLGDDTLEPGVQYLIDPRSGTAQGEFNIKEINSANFYSEYGGKINFDGEKTGQVIYAFNFTDQTNKETLNQIKGIAEKGMNYFPIIWVTTQKQMYSVGRNAKNYPLISIDSASYQTAETANIKINNKYIPRYQSKNVIGYIPGKKKKKYVVFSAHFDHLGRMGEQVYFPGANDNASGVAMLLSLAKYYIQHPAKYSIVFCFFSGEEAGLEGSKYFVSHPYVKLKKVKFVLNIDIMGGAEEGITIVNGTEHQESFDLLIDLNEKGKYLNKIYRRGPTANSDHYFFAESGVPAFFIYSMGNVKNYHDIFDTAENTPLNKFDEVQQLLIDFVKTL